MKGVLMAFVMGIDLEAQKVFDLEWMKGLWKVN